MSGTHFSSEDVTARLLFPHRTGAGDGESGGSGLVDGAFTCLIVGSTQPPPDSQRSIIGWLRLIASLPKGINEEGFFSMLLTQGLQSLRPPPTRIAFPCQ